LCDKYHGTTWRPRNHDKQDSEFKADEGSADSRESSEGAPLLDESGSQQASQSNECERYRQQRAERKQRWPEPDEDGEQRTREEHGVSQPNQHAIRD
jgi:hypothetical protein